MVEILIEKNQKIASQWVEEISKSVVVFPKKNMNRDFVKVKINDCTSATLIGESIS